MPDQLFLSLQAFPAVDQDKESLQYLIARVNEQRGSFRNVTEQSLEEDIRTAGDGQTNPEDEEVVDTVEDVHDAKRKREEVYQAREEILKHIAQAYQDSAHALDFVSLLLSKYNPTPAAQTMSPFLKTTVPLGCLGTEMVQAPETSDIEKHSQEMVSLGWRMQSLNGTADSLLKSATRLETEIQRETTYWDQVLTVKDHGWPLCRLPREKHTLGVRYGFAEAHADFRDRGLAALRRDEEGTITIDRGVRSSRDQTLRVRILQKGEPIASTSNTGQNFDDESLEKQLLHARNSIFDQELHHELHREARNLVNQGVRCAESKIFLPFERDKQIEIDLVSNDEGGADLNVESNAYSHIVALSLRILLSHAHRQNLRDRSQVPPPLREGQRPRPMHAILKPIVEILQHRSEVASVKAFLEKSAKTLAAAGFKASSQAPSSSLDYSALVAATDASHTSATEAVLLNLTAPLTTSLTLDLPSQAILIKTEVHTTLLPPTLGTTYQVFTSSPPTHHLTTTTPSSQMHFPSLPPLQAHLHHLTELIIKDLILTKCPTWRSSSLYTSTITRTKPGISAVVKDGISISCDAAGQVRLDWQRLSGGLGGQQAGWVWSEVGGVTTTKPDGRVLRRSVVDIVREVERK